MAKLTVRFQNRILGSYPLKAGFNTIGLDSTHPIRLKDPDVAPSHAFVLGDAQEKIFVLEDMQSATGTFVNKTRVRKRFLRPRDVITVGGHSLEFTDDDGRPEAAPEGPLGNVPVLVDMQSGKKIFLSKDAVRFGNGSGDDVHVPNRLAGKGFAALERDGRQWVLRLLAKRFCVLKLNGKETEKGALQDGDVLEAGGRNFRFFLNPP